MASKKKCKSPSFPLNKKFVFSEKLKQKLTDKDSIIQKEILKELVEKGSCFSLNPNIVEKFNINLPDISHNEGELDKLISSENTLDVGYHKNIACIISAILQNNPEPPIKYQKIRNWFKTPKIIGSPSNDGFALKTSFKPEGDLFVIKAARTVYNDNLIYEAAAGMYVTNLVRQYIPNFMYVYGYTQCSRIIVDETNKEIKSWCNYQGLESSYLIVENIRNSVQMYNFVIDPTVDANQLTCVLYQIFNALSIANNLYDYVHNDLHGDNVLVRSYFSKDSNKYLSIPIYDEKMKIKGYVLSQYVPYIIDYGVSVFSIGGKIFNRHQIPKFPALDIYTIINALGMYLWGKNIPFYSEKMQVLEKIFAFFGEGTIFEKISARNFKIVADKKHQKKSFKDFFDFTKDVFEPYLFSEKDIESQRSTGLDISFSSKQFEITSCDFYSKVASQENIESTLEYSNTLQSLQKSKFEPQKQKLINQIIGSDLKEVISLEIKSIKILEKDCINLIKNNNLNKDATIFLNSKPSEKEIIRQLYVLFQFRDIISAAFSIIGPMRVSIREQILKNQTKMDFYNKDIKIIEVLKDNFFKLSDIYSERRSEYQEYRKQFWRENKLDIYDLIISL